MALAKIKGKKKTAGRSATNVASIVLSVVLSLLSLLMIIGCEVVYQESKASMMIALKLAFFFFLWVYAALTYGLFWRKKWAFKFGLFACAANFLAFLVPTPAEVMKLPGYEAHASGLSVITELFLLALPLVLLALIWLQKNELKND